MSEHTRQVHEIFYWVEVALAPLLLWLVWIVTRELWRRGWLGDDWPAPPPPEEEAELAEPASSEEEPHPWRR